MTENSPTEGGDAAREIAMLERTLHETRQRLRELRRGEDPPQAGSEKPPPPDFSVGHLHILDALPAHMALLDAQGVIIFVNEAWREFGTNNQLQVPNFCVGENYVEVCDAATGDNSAEASEVARGIRQILSGEIKEYSAEYPCHSPDEKRWFRLMVTPQNGDDRSGAVVTHINITQPKLTEQWANLLAAIVKSSLDAIISKDLGGIVTSWNAGAQRIFGYTAEEIIGHSITCLIPQDRSNEEEQILARIRSGESVEHFDTVRVRKNGDLVDVSVTVSPVTDETGEIIGASKVARDISEAKRAEAALRDSQQALHLTLDAANIGYWDLDLITHQANRSVQHDRIFGYQELLPEWTYEQFLSHVIPEDRKRVDDLFHAGLEETTSWDFECRILRSDGVERWIWAHGNVYHNAAGVPVQMLGMVSDITARKVADAALRDSEQRLRFTLESCNIGAWDMDLVDHTAYRSVEHARIFGSADALTPWSVEDFLGHVLPEYRAKVESILREGTVAGRGWTSECPIRRADGEIRWIWFSGNYRKDPAGRGRIGGIVMDITERKRVEEAQRLSEARYRTLFEYAPDGIIIANQQSYYLDANPSMCRMLGYSREELIGLHASSVVAPAEISQIGSTFRQLANQNEYRREWQLRRKDGSFFAAEVIATMMPDDNLMAMIRDVTERNNAEQALREKEAQLHASDRRLAEIMHGMTEACFALDTEWRFTFVNARCETLLHHHREEMTGQSIWEIFQALVGTPMEAHYRRAMTERVPVSFEAFSPVAQRWLDIRLFPTGEGIAAFLLDIHARKLGEEALRETQMRLNSTLAAGSIGTWTWDIPNDCLVADEYTARVFSVDADAAAKGLPAEAYIRAILEEDKPSVAEGLARAIQSCSYYDIEYRVPQSDGEILWLQAKGRVEADASGNAATFHGAVIDITGRKRADEEIRELNTELEQRVIERTKQLEAANHELEAFSYSVSHDLRAPLRAMDGFSQAVIEDYGSQLPAEGQRYLRTIRNGAQHMGRLIDDLLAFSHLTRLPLARKTVDTRSLIRDSFRELKSEQQGREIEIRLGALPPSPADPALLKQVWLNLLSNAIKYTGRREHAVIEIDSLRTKGTTVYFVRDNGTGFDMRYAGKLFGVFQRLHRQDEFEGTGVGLALVQRIVHRHGGRVWAEAAVDQGATFYFTLEPDTEP